MSLECEIVEAYFESNGFLVRQTSRTKLTFSKKKHHPLPTIAVFNPTTEKNQESLGFRLYTGDLQGVRSSLVSLLGWENSSFTNAQLHSDSQVVKYFRSEAIADRLHAGFNPPPSLVESGMGKFLKLLVVPTLPKSENKLKQTFNLFQDLGVDGVLTLRSILENLLKQVMPSDSFLNNSVFQLLKLLKAYDMVREPQLDMFNE